MRGRAPLRSPLLLLRSLPRFLLRFLLLLLPLGSARAAGAETSPHLPAPQNVEIYSYNFQSWLRWSPVTVENGSVLYTAHYKTGSYREWSGMGCAHTPHTQCAFPPGLGRRWTVQLRVRAELGNLSSAWGHSPAFVPERDTTLGPPRVNSVSASPGSLLVSVTPPFTPEHGDSLLYLVSYWANSSSPAGKKELRVMETLFQIGNLQESTVYCFSIQVQLKIFSGHLLGEQRAPECHRTALSEAARAGSIVALLVVVFVAVNVSVAAVLLLWRHHHKIKLWAQAPLQIPPHFEEFLREPGLEELQIPAEEEPQAVVVGEGDGLEGEDAVTCRDRGATEGTAQ